MTIGPSEVRAVNGRKGGARVQSPEYLALRLVKAPTCRGANRTSSGGLLRPIDHRHRNSATS